MANCCKTYDPCLDGKINQIGSYASAARQSAQSAKTSETSAQAAAATAAAIAQSFSQEYLGAFPSPPTEPPSISEGALYWNTTSNSFYVWDGLTWLFIPLGFITNALVDPAAAIDFSKLASMPSGNILLGDSSNIPTPTPMSGDVTIDSTGVTDISAGVIVDADISPTASIDLAKLALGALPSGITIDSTNITDGSIVDADISASAAIGLSKLAVGALPSGVTVDSSNIVDGSIVNADISSSAEIDVAKLADGTPRQLLQTDTAGTGVEWTNDVDIPGTLDVTGVAVMDSSLTVAGNIQINGAGVLGYSVGSGGSISQATSRTTGVILNKSNGSIELFSDAGSASWQTFTVSNTTVAAADVIIVNQKSGADQYMIHVTNVSLGSFDITFATTGGTTTEQPVFNFAVIKAVTS